MNASVVIPEAIYAGAERPCAERFVAPVPSGAYGWSKPRGTAAEAGGLWTSPRHPEYVTHWLAWCVEESFHITGHDHLWELIPGPDASVYVIDTYDDLASLIAKYPAHDYLDEPVYPEWSQVAVDYDAVHLTEAGQWRTRLSAPANLYGWDCESTLWLRWCFADVVDLGTHDLPGWES